MTDKNQIKQYLQGRLQGLESIKKEREWTTAELGDIACCKQTLAFIDSLQEESTNNDLEEAADKHLVEKGYLLTTNNGEHLAEVEAKGLFKAGAQWQKEQILGDDNKQYHRLQHETLKRLYENEAKLELMLHNALEGYIEKYEQIGGHNYLSLKIPMLSKPDDCKDDEKVKLIIIKEE